MIITAHALQKKSPWITQYKWHTIIADEGYEFLRGQHNKADGRQSLTLQGWRRLQSCTKSMFIISGTAFVTKISYDFVAMTKAVARADIRAQWSPNCTDRELKSLTTGWISITDSRCARARATEDARRAAIAELLVIFMIRRTERSTIRGKPVMEDFFAIDCGFGGPVALEELNSVYPQYGKNSHTLNLLPPVLSLFLQPALFPPDSSSTWDYRPDATKPDVVIPLHLMLVRVNHL